MVTCLEEVLVPVLVIIITCLEEVLITVLVVIVSCFEEVLVPVLVVMVTCFEEVLVPVLVVISTCFEEVLVPVLVEGDVHQTATEAVVGEHEEHVLQDLLMEELQLLWEARERVCVIGIEMYIFLSDKATTIQRRCCCTFNISAHTETYTAVTSLF